MVVTEVFLWRTRISDAGLAHLQGMRQLQSPSLDNTQVSDAGLRHLGGLTQLVALEADGRGPPQRAVALFGTAATYAAAIKLARRAPKRPFGRPARKK